MADFANLVLGVDTSGLKRGERALNDTTKAAGKAEGKVRNASGQFVKAGNAAAAAAPKVGLLNRSTSLLSTSMASLRRQAGLAIAAYAAFSTVTASVRIVAEFETSISRLGAVSRATNGELEALRDIAKDLGSTTEFSASQAADGLNFLAMAGFNATEAMAAIPSVLDLATASGLGLAEAADTASNIMSGFGIEAANAAEVADVLAAASTRANTTVGQLGAAMSTVAPIASALDMSLEDTAAAIGVLSDAGIQGERAGTGLRGVLASLAGPTTQAESVLRGLGLTIADVDPATNDLSVVMARLGAAGLSTADAMTLFGREAASGALVLIDGAQRVGEFGDELSRADGAARTMAATMRDNLGGDLKGAASAAQGLAIALGDAGLTAIIRAVVQTISGLVRGITGLVDGFANMTTAISQMFGFASANEEIARTAGVAALAIEQEVKQADQLLVGLIEGRAYSVDYVGVKLAQAQAHLATADAIRQENIEAVKNSEVFRDAAIRQAQFNADIQAYYEFRAQAAAAGEVEGARDAERYRLLVENLQNAVNVQKELLGTVAETSPEVVAIQTEIDYLNTLISQSVDGVVTLEGGLSGSTRTAVDLSNTVAGINFSSSIDGAETLAQRLGVSLSLAMRIAATAGTSNVGNEVFDPRSPRFQQGSQDEANRLARLAEIREEFEQINIAAEAAALATDNFAGSAGGGGRAVEELADDLTDAEQAAINAADAFDGKLTSAVDSVASAFGDWVASGFQDFKGMMDSIINSFKSMISQLIATAIANPIKIALGIGGGGAAGGGGGMLQGVLGKALGGFGDTGSILGMGGLGGGTGLMGGAGNAISGGLGNIFNVGANAAAAGGGFMATLGAALPIIGIAAAVFSFFKTKTKVIDSGIKAVISMEDAVFQSFKEIEKSRFFGLSKKRSTSFKTLTGDNDAPLQAAVFGIRESVIGATESLGVSSDIFDNFTHDFSLSLKGLDEAARASAITEEFARMGDNLANLVPHIESMNQLFAVAANRVSLTDRLLQAQGETEELQARIRGREMEATNELNKALLAQVFAAEDAAAALNKLNASINENSFATGVDFRRGLSRASNGVEVTPQQSQAEMLAELKALNARIDVLQSTSEITANSSSQTAENTDYSNALTLDAAT